MTRWWNGAANVNPDAHLVLTLHGAPTLGTAGKIRIYDAASDTLVDTLDQSVLHLAMVAMAPPQQDIGIVENFLRQALLGHADLKPTSIYLHLSERHLRAAGTPLDNAELSSLDQVKRSRRLHKK